MRLLYDTVSLDDLLALWMKYNRIPHACIIQVDLHHDNWYDTLACFDLVDRNNLPTTDGCVIVPFTSYVEAKEYYDKYSGIQTIWLWPKTNKKG